MARLERISDFDAMACLIVFLRLAIENQNNAPDAVRLAVSLCRMAIVAAPFLYSHGVAGPLAEYFDGLLLSRQPMPERHAMQSLEYLGRAKYAAFYVEQFEGDNNRTLSQAERNDYLRDILNGICGPKIQAVIASLAIRESRPIIWYDKRQCCPTARVADFLEVDSESETGI